MLYSIIPPVLVLLSLAGIIVFLFKKSRKVAGLELLKNDFLSGSKRESFLGRTGKIREAAGGGLAKLFQAIREKSAAGFRRIALELGKIFTSWGESLREKRRRSTRGFLAKKEEDTPEITMDMSVEEKLEKYNFDAEPSKEDRGFFAKRSWQEDHKQDQESLKEDRSEEKEAFSRPVEKVEMKSQLEDALIERIAGNPKDTEAYERLGEYYFEIGNYDHSKECYKQVMKLSPGNFNARSRMRKLERMLGG